MDLPDGSSPEAANHPVLVSLARVKGALGESSKGGAGAAAEASGSANTAATATAAMPPAGPGFWGRLALAVDGFWRVFGLDLCALALLVAALVAANATSLIYLALLPLASSGYRVSADFLGYD
jgi:hypothetical protein